jgi:hypothetical protein
LPHNWATLWLLTQTRLSSMKTTIKGGTIRRLGVLLLVLAVSACHRVQPIYTVQGHPIPSASLGLKPEQITKIIVSTAQSKGWLVDPVGPTEVRATEKWKDHTAVVFISNDDKTFSIRNDDSTNLHQQGDMIHRTYNSRVHALEDAIERRLYQRP